MSVFTVENLLKTYGEKVLFDHISFSISDKQRIGLIGVNGTGKSTLLKVLAGIESTEAGDITHPNDYTVEYLPQHPNFIEDKTILEQIFQGDSALMNTLRQYEQALLSLEKDPENAEKQKELIKMQQKMDLVNGWEANTAAKTILSKLGITEYDRKINGLSGGQMKRVAIARALIQPANLLILDEPTNHLDNETVEWLETFLAQYKGALLLVTHDRYFLNRVTNRIFELDQGKLYQYDGNYEIFLEKKAEREENEISSEKKRQNLLRRELAWLRRGAKARTTKQKARIDRIHEIKDKEKTVLDDQVDIAIGSTRLGKKVMEVSNITKSMSGHKFIEDFSYLMIPGERLGIIGPNGSGKTTLLNILAGVSAADSGSIEIGQTVKIGYYTQDAEEMDENLRVIDYIKETAEIVKTVDGQIITAEQMLERFLFSRNAQWTYIRKLSGGERRRLYLLKILMEEPNVLFLDEPTNDLDTKTLTILEEYLEQFPGCVITVSHDRYFLDRVVDHLLAFEGNGNIQRFQGNYSDYLATKNEQKKSAGMLEEVKKDAVPMKKQTKERKKLSYKDQKEWEEIEDKIAGLELKIEELNDQINEAGSDIGKVQELYRKKEQVETDLEKAMERWEELSLLVEEMEQSKG